jgi:hypothetical protein
MRVVGIGANNQRADPDPLHWADFVAPLAMSQGRALATRQ